MDRRVSHRWLPFVSFAIAATAVFVSGCPGPATKPVVTAPSASTVKTPATAVPTVTPTASSASGFPDANMARSEIPDKYKWDLSPLFTSDEAFDQALGAVAAERKKLANYRGKLSQAKQLEACLELYFRTRLKTKKLTMYANLRQDTDQKSTKRQAMQERSLAAMRALMDTAGFIRQELLAMSDAALARAYRSQKKLAEYRPYIDEIRRRRGRVLDAKAERILSLAGDNLWAEIDLNEIPSDLEKVFKSLMTEIPLPQITDENGKRVQLTFSNYGKYRGSKVRRVRADTVESFFATLSKYEQTFAAALAGQVRFNIFLARARGYDTALEAYLDKDDINPEVYRSLVRAINANLKPLHKYMALRKRLMGVKELHIYDLYAPLIKTKSIQVPYEKALSILPKALAPLGGEYLAALRTGLDPANGWVDVYPHKDKQSGAFMACSYGVHPYVKVNYFNEVNDFSTLAHEFGHAIHSHMSMVGQPHVTAQYASFVAEIASTVNEKLLSDYLLARAKNNEEKLTLLNALVETIRTTIYRQALFAEFEVTIHTAAEKGRPLTADFFNKTYAKLIKTYYGPDFTVGKNDGVEWAYIPHFYYKYYVFTYATGLSSGIALAERIQSGGTAARDAYLGMLKGGSSKPPLQLLKDAGVDLTKPQAFEAAAKLLNRTLTELEAVLPKQ